MFKALKSQSACLVCSCFEEPPRDSLKSWRPRTFPLRYTSQTNRNLVSFFHPEVDWLILRSFFLFFGEWFGQKWYIKNQQKNGFTQNFHCWLPQEHTHNWWMFAYYFSENESSKRTETDFSGFWGHLGSIENLHGLLFRPFQKIK